jgi:hypothetical protein
MKLYKNKTNYNIVSATTGLVCYSSLAMYGYYLNNMMVFIVCMLIALSSVLFHLNNQIYALYVFDQICIVKFTILCFLHSYFNIYYFSLFIINISYAGYVFHYGRVINNYCYHKNECISYAFQSSIHILTSSCLAYVL